MIYALVGFMASGKSTIGRMLASKLGAEFIDLDEFIVDSQKMSIANIFALQGEVAFREIEYNCLNKIIGLRLPQSLHSFAMTDNDNCYCNDQLPNPKGFAMTNDVIASEAKQSQANKDLVISLGGGTFINEKSRKLILETTKSIYLQLDISEIKRRLANDNGKRPLAANFEDLYKKRKPIYQLASISVDTNAKSPNDVAELLLKILNY